MCAREDGAVGVDVVDGELHGETRGAANGGVVGEERAHGHLAGRRRRRRDRGHGHGHGEQRQAAEEHRPERAH